MPGLTLIEAEVAPVLQRKLVAPLTVSVADPPTQSRGTDALTDTVGATSTATVTDALAEQPPSFVTVTS